MYYFYIFLYLYMYVDIFGHLILSFMGSVCGMASVRIFLRTMGGVGAKKSPVLWGAS